MFAGGSIMHERVNTKFYRHCFESHKFEPFQRIIPEETKSVEGAPFKVNSHGHNSTF
jgi:hypothetical protein